jgi:hypothetical protein
MEVSAITVSSTILVNIVNYFRANQEKRVLLEPMTTLGRLALLSFYPSGTKVSISANKVELIGPSILQPLFRWRNGDTRQDLHNLYGPIIKFMSWYDPSNPEIQFIVDVSLRGLVNLCDTYEENSTIAHSLLLYHSLLSAYRRNERPAPPIPIPDWDRELNAGNPIYGYMRSHWSSRQQTMLYDILRELVETPVTSPSHASYVKTLDDLLSMKEQELRSYILKATTPSSPLLSSMTQEPLGPAASLPASATSLPAPAVSLPAPAVSLPASAASLPASATSLPAPAVSLPAPAASLPDLSSKTRGKHG